MAELSIRVSYLDLNMVFSVKEVLADKIRERGWRYFDGTLSKHDDFAKGDTVYTYTPGKLDILFRKFDAPKPEWQIQKEKQREILFRKFQ